MGGSDIAGELTVEGFETPQVRFDLRSDSADFWELVSFVSGSGDVGGAEDPQSAALGGMPQGTVVEGWAWVINRFRCSLTFG